MDRTQLTAVSTLGTEQEPPSSPCSSSSSCSRSSCSSCCCSVAPPSAIALACCNTATFLSPPDPTLQRYFSTSAPAAMHACMASVVPYHPGNWQFMACTLHTPYLPVLHCLGLPCLLMCLETLTDHLQIQPPPTMYLHAPPFPDLSCAVTSTASGVMYGHTSGQRASGYSQDEWELLPSIRDHP